MTWKQSYPNHCTACLGTSYGLEEDNTIGWCQSCEGSCPRCKHNMQDEHNYCTQCGWINPLDGLTPCVIWQESQEHWDAHCRGCPHSSILGQEFECLATDPLHCPQVEQEYGGNRALWFAFGGEDG